MEKTFEHMLNAVGDSVRDIASSDDEQDGTDNVEYTLLGTLSADDDPGSRMGEFSQMVQQHFESFLHKQMKIKQLV